MKLEFSAGGVVFKKDQQGIKFLLIKNPSLKDATKFYWGFPKGGIEKGESSKETALREVKEETGIKAKIVAKIEDSKYIFTGADGEKIFKVVSIYLMESKSGELTKQLTEISDIGWFTKEEVLEKLSFSNDKKLFKNALAMLS